MTSSELKRKHMESNPDSRFFDRTTMKFFGDTMQNFGVRKTTVTPNYGKYADKPVEVWELHRKKPVKHGLNTSRYFHIDTFELLYYI